MKEKRVVYFDGICNLCNGFINFLIKIDRKKRLRYAPLQKKYAQNKLNPIQTKRLETIFFSYKGSVYEKSDAILEIFNAIGGLWKITLVCKIFPKIIRNFFYNIVVKHRYKIFGKNKECRIPSKKEKELFLE